MNIIKTDIEGVLMIEPNLLMKEATFWRVLMNENSMIRFLLL